MAEQPKVFKKNFLDLDFNKPTITVTDATASNTGQSFLDFIRNRDNNSGWATTGSNDAANTQLDIDLVDVESVDSIILVGHNFDSYTIQYFNGSNYVDFSTAINESNVTDTVSEHQFTAVSASQFRLIITATKTPNADKTLNQLIITRKIQGGQFIGWPKIRSTQISTEKRTNTTLSGKVHVKESIGGYSSRLELRSWPESAQADLDMVDAMFFDEPNGFLFWPCGGDEAQFRSARHGFRKKDIYLCKIANEYNIEYSQDTYNLGQNINISLVEVI